MSQATDYSRARTIVSSIAAHGHSHAVALYGHHLCNWALFIMRGHIAQRQAKRARDEGAVGKRLARRNAARKGWVDISRAYEMFSRREYRKAARYDDTAQGAALMAMAHEGLVQFGPGYLRAPACDRLAHFQPA